jgi:hypothetical protein
LIWGGGRVGMVERWLKQCIHILINVLTIKKFDPIFENPLNSSFSPVIDNFPSIDSWKLPGIYI